MHGARWTSHPTATLSTTLPPDDDLIRYRFGHGTATFMVCANCGILPLAVDTRGDRTCAVVNVNTFETLDPHSVPTTETSFEGESDGERSARRQRNWSPIIDGIQQ